jgi:hypothetical protein
MTDSQEPLVQGRTRWRRFAAVLVPAVVAIGAIGVGVANGAIPASFSISGQQFKISADKLSGTNFDQFGGVVNKATGGAPIPVAVSTIDDATLTNLCQSVATPTPLGTIVLQIKAGTAPGAPATAHDLVIAMSELTGDATFTDIQIGRDGGDLEGGPSHANGSFGQHAAAVEITGLQQKAYSTSAGTFTLKGLSMKLLVGGGECF